MKRIPLLMIAAIVLLCSCGKNDAAAKTPYPPSNLVVNAIVSTDNSGNVSFTSTATHAVTYDYDFGNAVYQTVPSGIVTYKFPASGDYTINVTAKSTGGQTVSKSIRVTVTVILSLFWSEEFNTDGAPDPAKWGYDLGAGGWGNAELEYYTSSPANVIVNGGVLKIKAIKENFNGSPYTSARLLSKDKFAFKYGRVEVRAKLPAGIGTWPAIWMLGADNSTAGWPECGEIDIMEHVGRNLNTIYGTLHYPGRSGGNADGSTKLISNATTEFHIYKVDWSAVAIKIFVDDELYHSVANSDSLPFNHDFFLILNIAMGGGLGGAVDPAFTNATLEVDYIRVYR